MNCNLNLSYMFSFMVSALLMFYIVLAPSLHSPCTWSCQQAGKGTFVLVIWCFKSYTRVKKQKSFNDFMVSL